LKHSTPTSLLFRFNVTSAAADCTLSCRPLHSGHAPYCHGNFSSPMSLNRDNHHHILTQMSPWVLTLPQSSKHVDTSSCTCGHKGGLLQHRSLAHFPTTVTTAAVCLQHRRSSRVLSEEVRARNSTPLWTTLAESSGENSFPVMCSRISLP